MSQAIATVALLVADYDDAIVFYREKLGFSLVEDTPLVGQKRWVVVAQADGQEQQNAVGRQAGGRVMFFLETEDFAGDYARMKAAGVSFLEAPRHEAYGSVVVFEDLYGNRWDLIEPAQRT